MDGENKKDEEKKDKQEQKGGVPEWVQKLEQSMNRLAEKLETVPEQKKDNPVEVPVPPTPKPETPDEPDELETPDEPETPQEKPKSKGKSFLDWLL